MERGILVKKRIVLVHPRGFNWFPGHRDITDITNRMVPQGLLSHVHDRQMEQIIKEWKGVKCEV